MTDSQQTTSAEGDSAKSIGIIRTYDQLTLDRINLIEEIPLALDSAMESTHKAIHRDMPKEMRPPGDNTVYYRYAGGKYVITSWDKSKLIKSIVDDKCVHDGQLVSLHGG